MDTSAFLAYPIHAAQPRSVKISIVTAGGHCSRNLFDCLESVQSQTHRHLEHIVIDSSRMGSLGGRQLAQHPERITLVRGLRGESRFDAWNRGIAHASGEVLAFLDADDLLGGPEVLDRVAQAFEDPWLAAVYGNVKHVQQDNPHLVVRHQRPGPFSTAKLAWGWAPPTSALFVRRHWYQRIGGFSPLFTAAADYDATLRLFAHRFFKSEYLDEPLVRQRITPWRPAQLGQTLNRPVEELRALRKARLGGLPAVVWKNLSKVGLYL